MKKNLSISGILFLLSFSMLAQVGPGFNFQGVARNSNGDLIKDASIDLEVGIRSGSESGTLVWKEKHTTTSNEFGLFTIEICGDNDLRDGGSAMKLEDIDWASDNHFIELKMDAGQGLTDMGTSQLLSVPYSMVARSYPSTVPGISVQPETTVEQGEALFMVKREDGYPVFAVYEDGVWVYTDDSRTEKGIKGGFAVGGYNASTKGPGPEYFMVSPDSARIYVNSKPGKGIKGGFAVGGYNASGKGIDEFMRVTRDSTRIYVNPEPQKGIKGGFAVGGYNAGKAGQDGSFMSLTRDNYFIGHNSGAYASGLYNSVMGYESGLNITSGESNAFMGYQAGYLNDVGSGNLFLGYQTGYSNSSGNYNTFLGYQAGYQNNSGLNNTFLGSFAGNSNQGGSFNTFVGDSTGYRNVSGENNTFLGTKSGRNNTTGFNNVFLGNETGYMNEQGGFNVFIGHNSGYSNENAFANVFIGTDAGYNSVAGWNNIYIGTQAGISNTDGDGNVMIGYESGFNNENGTRNVFIGNRAGRDEKGSEKLYISTSEADSTGALLWGDFIARNLRFNALVGIGRHPEPGANLSIYRPDGTGSLLLQGYGNDYDYSAIYLGADTIEKDMNYTLSHTKTNDFFLGYNDGSNVFRRMLINSEGNFGFNTTPGNASMTILNENGTSNILLQGTGTGGANDFSSIILESSGQSETTNYNLTHSKDGHFYIGQWDGSLYFPRLKIAPNGYVSLNSWDDATEMLDVAGNARFRGVGNAAMANDLRITGDGTLTTSTSDARLKSDVQPLINSLEKILKLEGYTFTWKEDEQQTRDAGMVAQEVAEIFPEAVFINPNDGYYGINYSRFPALFVEAFKEQQSIIEDQNKEIDELKVRLSKMEAYLGIK